MQRRRHGRPRQRGRRARDAASVCWDRAAQGAATLPIPARGTARGGSGAPWGMKGAPTGAPCLCAAAAPKRFPRPRPGLTPLGCCAENALCDRAGACRGCHAAVWPVSAACSAQQRRGGAPCAAVMGEWAHGREREAGCVGREGERGGLRPSRHTASRRQRVRAGRPGMWWVGDSVSAGVGPLPAPASNIAAMSESEAEGASAAPTLGDE